MNYTKHWLQVNLDRQTTYKTIASGFSSLSVSNDNSFLDFSKHFKVFSEAGVGGVIGKTSDEDLGVCGVLLRAVHPHESRRGARSSAKQTNKQTEQKFHYDWLNK